MTEDVSWLVLVAILPVVFYVASTWERIRKVEKTLDLMLQNFEGLRQYLYEIDPQFEDERQSNVDLDDERNLFAAQNDMELLDRKHADGKRTLDTPFHD
jgi:hypothetical protein